MNMEQLLGQGEEEYMSAAQLAFFKELLTKKSDEISGRIEGNKALCQIQRQADAADSASTEEERDKAMRLIDLDNLTLVRVREALQAIEDEEYGYCADTGEAIGLKRLLVVPESLLSVDAMAARETRGRHMRAA